MSKSIHCTKDELQKELNCIYEQWSIQALNICRHLEPDLKYSNPYYIYVPETWVKAKNRIMIVGEEGYGIWGRGSKFCTAYGKDYGYEWKWEFNDIGKIQSYNGKSISDYGKSTPFWRRYSAIAQICGFDIACVWNNLDKIHSIEKRPKLCYRLSESEECALHSTNIKILKEEINILQPSVIVFFGWHYKALEMENLFSKEKYEELYNNWYKCRDDKNWIAELEYELNGKTVKCIFTQHPGWRGKHKPKNYEETIIKLVESNLCK